MPDTVPANNVAEPLPSKPSRQAVDTLGGYDYQVWCSIEAWMLLEGDEVLYLEGAEDIDRVGPAASTATQVKRTAGTVSLNTAVAREAIKNFWMTVQAAPDRVVKFVFLTTSTVAMEQNAAFVGLKGIEAWEKAEYDAQLADLLRAYLVENLGSADELRSFLSSSAVEEVQKKFFSRFVWLTGQPSVEVVKASVTQRLEEWCNAQGLAPQTAIKIRETLFSRCWEQVLQPTASERRLDARLLARTREEATSIYLKLPLKTAQGR